MKHKFVALIVLLSLLGSGYSIVFAQGPLPPTNSDDPATLPKSAVNVPLTERSSLEAGSSRSGDILTLTNPTIVNGGFEQGRNVGWSEFSTHGRNIVITSPYLLVAPHGGSWAAWLGGEFNDVSRISQANVSIVNPTHLQLWYWIASAETSCNNDFGYVKVNSNTVYTWNLCKSNNTNGWAELSLDLSAYGGQAVTLSVEATTNSTENSNLFIDDVSFYPTFADVPYGYWAQDYIYRLFNAGITGGCGTNPLIYCPESQVTRAQMAIFLLKGIHGSSYPPPPVGTSTGFADVATTYWAAAWIKQLAAEGITGGCGNNNYCPDSPVTRAQMAVFLLKAKYGSGYKPPLVGSSTGFTDVPTTYWAAAWIKQLAAEGITGGCGTGIYCPENPVTRAQMAVFLVKTFNLP